MLTQIISANSFFRSAMVCALLFSAVAHARSSDTEEGWARLVENKDENAIAAFTKALNANPSDARASMGMTYAYWLRLNHKKSWEHFKSAISNSSNPHAYLYAGVSSERYGYGTADPQSGAAELWKEILKNPDANGVMRAMAYEHLGFMADRDGDVEGAKQWYSKVGAITSWRMIGPFHNISASGHNKAFQPELTDDPSGKYEGESGCAVHWFQPKVVRNDSWMDFTEYFPWADGVYYSVVYVKSAAAQRVHFRLGTSGAYKLFLNDSLVGETIDEFNNDLDTYNYVVSLPAGWSKVLVKIDNSELDRSNFLFRITDSVGVALEGLEYTTQPQLYSHQNPNAVQLENSFINYFKQQIKQHPDYLENRLLLAEAYLRNDNVIDAQQVLGEILKQHPDFICALTLLADSYRRGRRSDDLVTTIERITTLRPDLPTSIVYKFYRALQSDRMDDAESMLSEIQTALPRSTDYYETAIRVARQKNEIAQVNTLTKSAFQDHPDNYAFASACMSIALMSEGRHAEALQIADKHLKARYSAAGLAIKGRIYLNDGRVSDWEDMFKKVLELNPANVAIYSEMSGTYTMRKDYAKAIEAVKQALEIAPTNSSYWFELGTLYRSQNNKPDAIDCMKKAIEFNPSYFSAREALRDLMEQPAPLTLVTPYNIDSLMASSPDADAFPDDDAIYLLDDESRVVLDGSRCEVLYETLVKVFTKDGIDRFKEMSLPGGSNSAIEKAVVRKARGGES